MSVKLIAITKPVISECSSSEELLAYCAKVSNPMNQANHLTAPKLLKYLINNQHWSPFEMVHLVIEITTTRDIGRQILRHRSFSFQEFSQRYAEVVADPVFKEARLQDTKNRQNSREVEDADLHGLWNELQSRVSMCAYEAYNRALELGIAKEQARAVLPEGLTSTTMYMAGTLRSWLHYCWLRTGNGTQKEHKQIADECLQIIQKEFPSLNDN